MNFIVIFICVFSCVQGDLVTEEEVVNVLVGVFLHPSYTIPLIGCFRPIAQHIVDKAVALLRLVPNLMSIPKDTAREDDRDRVLDGVVNVIEFYSQQGRGLDLHELACLAFCRALDMGPFLLRLISSMSLFLSIFSVLYMSFTAVCFHRWYSYAFSRKMVISVDYYFKKLGGQMCLLHLLSLFPEWYSATARSYLMTGLQIFP